MFRSLDHVPRPEKIAAMTSVVISLLLLCVKFLAYFLTGSAAIFSDAMESIVNVLASGVAFYSLSLAHLPADAEHPYGHGKVEFLSATFEGGMILLAAIAIFLRTADMVLAGNVQIQELGLGLLLIAAAMLVNLAVGGYLLFLGNRRRSMTLEADGKHLLSDAITSVAALAALGIIKLTGWLWMDPVAAVLIAAYIAWMGLSLLRRSFGGLMDKQDIALEKEICRILDSHKGKSGKEPRICNYHKLRHRHSGRYRWVDFHIQVPGNMDVCHGHHIASTIEYEIEQAIGEGNATAHVEPCPATACPDCKPAHAKE